MALPAPTRLHGTNPLPLPAGLRQVSPGFALRSSFVSPSTFQLVLVQPATAPAARFSMRVASKQAYICRDCGYIYNDRTPFEKLPDNYFCPVCSAPKRRFKPYTPAVSKNANDKNVRKARKSQLQRDEAIGQYLPYAVALGVAALVAVYFYVNTVY